MNAAASIDEGLRKIVAKIAKLLRRAERDDGHEAKTALRMAERLMAKHGVQVDLHEFDNGQEPVVADRLVLFLKDRSRSMWAQFMLQQVAPLYGCTNRQQQSEAGYQFYLLGPAAHVEPASIHFEYLMRRVQKIAAVVGETLGHSPMDFFSASLGRRPPYELGDARIVDSVHWGVMDGLLNNLRRKGASSGGDTVAAEVTKLETRFALPPAPSHVVVRGNEVVHGGGDLKPFEFSAPEVDAPEPAYWAWHAGWSAVKPSEACEPPDILFNRIQVLGLPQAVIATLADEGVFTVAQLVRMRPSALIELLGAYDDFLETQQALEDHELLLALEWEDEV